MKESLFIQMAVGLRNRAQSAALAAGASPTEADDAAQDTMLRLWQMHGELSAGRNLGALAALIARRQVLNERRRTGVFQTLGSLDAALFLDDPHAELEAKETVAWLEWRMDNLPPTEHTILYMRQVEQRSNDDIARLLGLMPASVSTLLARARHTLLEEIKRRRRNER